MAVAAAKRKDFLRHIVNRVLASPDTPRQLVDDIRRHVGRAEDRYKFHAFGGDVRRLADYLRSRDFDDLINVARSERSGKGLEVLKKILEEAKKAYSDIPEVVAAIDERLKQIEELMRGAEAGAAEAEAREDPLARLESRLAGLRKLGVSIERSGDKIRLKMEVPHGYMEASILYDREAGRYRVDARLEAEARRGEEVARLIERLASGLRG